MKNNPTPYSLKKIPEVFTCSTPESWFLAQKINEIIEYLNHQPVKVIESTLKDQGEIKGYVQVGEPQKGIKSTMTITKDQGECECACHGFMMAGHCHLCTNPTPDPFERIEAILLKAMLHRHKKGLKHCEACDTNERIKPAIDIVREEKARNHG